MSLSMTCWGRPLFPRRYRNDPIKIHHTATSDAAWDGPAAKANLKNDAEETYYRKAFAWEDPERGSQDQESLQVHPPRSQRGRD